MSSLDELFEAGGDDDRPPLAVEVADHEPQAFRQDARTSRTGSRLLRPCWSWTPFIAKCWCCGSMRIYRLRRLPRSRGRRFPR